MKILIFSTLFGIALLLNDTIIVITKPKYTVYFDKDLKVPLYTKHKLYKVVHNCDRGTDHFIPETSYSAHNSDYDKAYDKGHLVSAEDMSSNCDDQLSTFTYVNCFPQTPNLNRGIWKKDEELCQKVFCQKDSILIYSGGIFLSNHKTIGNGISVPDSCFKYIVSLSTHKVILCRVYTNMEHNNFFREAKLEQIEKLISRKLQ